MERPTPQTHPSCLNPKDSRHVMIPMELFAVFSNLIYLIWFLFLCLVKKVNHFHNVRTVVFSTGLHVRIHYHYTFCF